MSGSPASFIFTIMILFHLRGRLFHLRDWAEVVSRHLLDLLLRQYLLAIPW